MAGGIWEALGSALQQGAHTYGQLGEQERVEKLRRDQMAQDQSQFQARQSMDQQQLDEASKERRQRVMMAAIEGAAPGTDFTSLQPEAQELGLNSLFTSMTNKTPGIPQVNVRSGLGGTGLDGGVIDPGGPATTATPATYQRRASLAEQGAQQKLDIVSGLTGPSGKLTPDQQTRFAVEVGGGSANGVLGQAPKSQNEYDDDLVRAVIADPNAWHKLPKTTQDRIGGKAAAAGFKGFGTTPVFEEAVLYRKERDMRVGNVARELLADAGMLTTGLGSTLTGWLPGTPAYDWGAKLDTLKANIMTAEITAMRQASKTGGSVGQVSDFEGRLFSSARAALDQAQSPQQVREELNKLIKGVEEAEKMWAAALPAAGGGEEQDAPETTPQARSSVNPALAGPQASVNPALAPRPAPQLGAPMPMAGSRGMVAPPAATGGKTATVAEINEYARAKGMTGPQAAAKLKALGYTIGN